MSNTRTNTDEILINHLTQLIRFGKVAIDYKKSTIYKDGKVVLNCDDEYHSVITMYYDDYKRIKDNTFRHEKRRISTR